MFLGASLAAEWQAATDHPFLAGVRDGTLTRQAFQAWLAQDYLFVRDLLAFQARLLARAPRHAQAVLASGLVSLESELGWFEEHAGRRRLVLDVPRQATTIAYRALLERQLSEPFAIPMAALWAVERAYLGAWRTAAPGAPEFAEFVQHWTAEPFAEYVRGLQVAAEFELQAVPHVLDRATGAVRDVLALERDFWAMAFVGQPPA
jgi:thiaminase/transcriptional activator TenA